MTTILIAIGLAAVAYMISSVLGLPAMVGAVAALLVLLASIPSASYGLGRRDSRP